MKIRIPQQHISRYSLFSATESAARQWCQELPMGDAGGLARQLVSAVDEFNRVILPSQPRYAVLESLRPVLQQALSLLSARLTNQPLVLPPAQQKLADLVDRLSGLASTAYSLAAIHALQETADATDTLPANLVAEALQRSIGFAGHKIIHAHQLHQPLDPRAWSGLHKLYALAETQHLEDRPVEDAPSTTTIAATYLKPVLLSCCQPNQLRQQDIVVICASLDSWLLRVTLRQATNATGLFAVNLAGERPPVYTSTVPSSALVDHRIIDTAPLCRHLESLLRDARQAKLPNVLIGKSIRLPVPLLDHVIQSLESERLRGEERTRTRQSVEVALGFRNSHFHLAGQRGFEELLQGNCEIAGTRKPVSGNLFLLDPDADDAWSVAVGRDLDRKITGVAEPAAEAVVEFSEESPATPTERPGTGEGFPLQRVTAIDASAGGYCLEWTSEFPERIGNGHILGLRATGTTEWRLATIRWIIPRRHQATMAGIELLSSCASPWGASVQRNTPEKPVPVRVFLLPATAQPAVGETLVTPRSGFAEGQRVLLVREGESRVVTLLKHVAMNAAFSQFELVTETPQPSDTAFMQNTPTDIDFDFS
ncbi:hypothetical protein CWI75_11340 [Kineobactrum sediminis]|uniref:GTPase n=1 Tax=Kineobactrum sediminis TaxID=1905677 RepID=A0A2N5Y1T3_9GAMM|nr:hypothetical protein CWI75_11340 [Kineobactrum sediminis]